MKGCIDMLEELMAHFHSKLCFCSLKDVILQRFCILSALFRPSQEARLPTFLGQTDPQNMTDAEFESSVAKHCGLSF